MLLYLWSTTTMHVYLHFLIYTVHTVSNFMVSFVLSQATKALWHFIGMICSLVQSFHFFKYCYQNILNIPV